MLQLSLYEHKYDWKRTADVDKSAVFVCVVQQYTTYPFFYQFTIPPEFSKD